MIKTAIVTGVSGGIGYACADILLKNGYKVCGADVSEGDFSAFKDNFVFVKASISENKDREKIVSAAISNFGAIGALVNVAGVAPLVRRDLLEMTEDSYDRVMSINTKGTMFLTQKVANEMLKQPHTDGLRGSIVNISSCSAYTSSVSRGEYCVSKAGVSMVTTLFADRLASEHITVNEICPGIIHTGMTATVREKYDHLIAQGLVPLNRWGEPEDVAKAVFALINGSFGYTTGQSIAVDGGMHIRKL